MHVLGQWQWRKIWWPPEMTKKPGAIALVEDLILLPENGNPDWSLIRQHDTVLITGDGKCLASDVKAFEEWDVPHDLYCVNRSLIFFERQVHHWAAIDIEESAWFSENMTGKVIPKGNILRHTIGYIPGGFDVWWERNYAFTNDNQRRLFIGNTGYFATLTAIQMGYEKIVLAGMPLNSEPHFYDPEGAIGPSWYPHTYMQWMDFKMKSPNADKVRSMSGYSGFILGQATEVWCRE